MFRRMEHIQIYYVFFRDKGHSVYVACTRERRQALPTCIEEQERIKILRIRIGNITKVNFIEKGLSTLMVERQFQNAIKKIFWWCEI